MIQIFKKENVTKRYEVQYGKVLCTIKINNRWVSNPSLTLFLQQGWEEYTPPEPTHYTPTYEELVVMKIRERYPINDEFKCLRERDTNPEQFNEYYTYVEQCKQEAQEELANISQDASNEQ